jgi:hypothetical protein
LKAGGGGIPCGIGALHIAAAANYIDTRDGAERDNRRSAAARQKIHGQPGSAWTPVMGDWDGGGTATIGLFDPASAHWYLRNSNDQGIADVHFGFGAPGQGWQPIVGNWLAPAPVASTVAPVRGTTAVDPQAVDRLDLPMVAAPAGDALLGLDELAADVAGRPSVVTVAPGISAPGRS